jgi:hypothetical protein
MPKLNLQKREKLILAAGVGLALVILVQFAARGPLDEYRSTKRAVAAARTRVNTAIAQRDQVLAERSSGEALRKALGGRSQGDLFAFVNRQLTQAGLFEGDRAKMRNSTNFQDQSQFQQVEVQFTGVTVEEIVNFLHGLYTGGGVVVTHSMRMQPVVGGTGLQCRLVLLSPKP